VRIVLDTNVLIAALLSPHGAPAQLLDLALARQILLLVDDRILAEYHEVARRPMFGFSEGDLPRVLNALTALAEHVAARPLPVILPDDGDVPFLEVAVAGQADALVTGNTRHFVPKRGHHAVRVRAPREELDDLRGEG
jgi:uncharacterized protein